MALTLSEYNQIRRAEETKATLSVHYKKRLGSGLSFRRKAVFGSIKANEVDRLIVEQSENKGPIEIVKDDIIVIA